MERNQDMMKMARHGCHSVEAPQTNQPHKCTSRPQSGKCDQGDDTANKGHREHHQNAAENVSGALDISFN